MTTSTNHNIANDTFELSVRPDGHQIHLRLQVEAAGFTFADGPYLYRAIRSTTQGAVVFDGLESPTITPTDNTLTVTGELAGLRLTHQLALPSDQPHLEERVILENAGDASIDLSDIALGLRRRITNAIAQPLPELTADRFVAVPLRHRAPDPAGVDQDLSLHDLVSRGGEELRVTVLPSGAARFGYVPVPSRFSEGWAWTHASHAFCIFKFNQNDLEFSALTLEDHADGLWLRFAGTTRRSGAPFALDRIDPGQTVELGVTRIATVAGGFTEACYAFRAFLDEQSCRFPPDYDPPVHWNELYDNPEWAVGTPGRPAEPRLTRRLTYTKALLLEEAAKARDYGCQALYLDPGWDTDMATLEWGTEWLGDRKTFIAELSQEYSLGVALHCPLAPWLTFDGRGVPTWPPEAARVSRDDTPIEGSVCLGSRQYLDTAAERLIEHCADGVAFLMFDGNWWGGDCWSTTHGHPVPYTHEDHCRASLDLAQRIHARFPSVLVEMHDMIAGGRTTRFTPVYYKHGIPRSYDENWGFELMWQPLDDIQTGRARTLYDYNLGCNIPLYLHIDLRDDNEHALALWWYASTCRHLGIGGTHDDPRVASLQRSTMKRYRALDRYFKRGQFFGFGHEVHVHALPDEHSMVVNLFNLSDEPKDVGADIPFDQLGLDPNRWYVPDPGHPTDAFDPSAGTLALRRSLPPWSPAVIEVRALDVSTTPVRDG
jgi:hypothetical protein